MTACARKHSLRLLLPDSVTGIDTQNSITNRYFQPNPNVNFAEDVLLRDMHVSEIDLGSLISIVKAPISAKLTAPTD